MEKKDMPKVLNFGSLNLDYVYQVSHFVKPGETLGAESQAINAGGKGLNQSVALARRFITPDALELAEKNWKRS